MGNFCSGHVEHVIEVTCAVSEGSARVIMCSSAVGASETQRLAFLSESIFSRLRPSRGPHGLPNRNPGCPEQPTSRL